MSEEHRSGGRDVAVDGGRRARRAASSTPSRPAGGRPPWARAYSFLIVTGALFLISWTGQFVAQAVEVRNEAEQHGASFSWGEFWPQFLASTFENWQSEFLQLCWQAAGLAFLLFWGSSQSRESGDRLEAKVDVLLRERGLDPDEISQRVNARI